MTTLTCMTYNIRLGIQRGLDDIARVIARRRPQILAIQEIGENWVMGPEGDSTATLANTLGYPHVHHVKAITRDGAHHYGHAILSDYPFTIVDEIELERHEDEPRRLLHTRHEHPELGEVEVVSTHLSWIGDRTVQGEFLASFARELTSAHDLVLVMGDLNEEHTTTPWLAALRSSFQDADASRARLTFPSNAPRIRLDYLLSSRGTWTETEVFDDEREASDHYPVVSTLVIEE